MLQSYGSNQLVAYANTNSNSAKVDFLRLIAILAIWSSACKLPTPAIYVGLSRGQRLWWGLASD